MDDEHRTKSDLKTELGEQRREERLELLLRERGKELKCLYDLSRLAERTGFSLEEFLKGAANLLPTAWQYPDITCARVVLDGREFSTKGFETTLWEQSADIMLRGEKAGTIEVFYRKAKPDLDEGPFSKEGRELLNAVAEQLGRTIERFQEVDTIRRQKEFLETIIESIATPFFVLDANDYTIRMANSAARQLGVLGEDTKCYELTRNNKAPCQSDDCPCPLGLVKATGKPAAVVQHSLAADGSPSYHDVRAYPVFNKEGRVEQVIEHMIDITEHRQIVEALRKSQQELDRRVRERTAELEAANRELESFAYSVSHDLRAPLRAIDGFSQALVEDHSSRLGQEGLDYLQRVSNAAQRMALLIDDLLELSRVTRAGMRREPVDLSAMAREVVAGIRETRPQREVSLSIADGLSVRGDPPLLRLALENLLDNAFKFSSTKPRTRIELGKMERDGETVYFVKDGGVGFDMAYAGKLFMPFQRLHSRAEFPGTGVGLATVQRVIHRHGGRVWGEGELDRGATFYFTLLHHERLEK